MSALTNVWRQLVQRRLWPVAIILIAALAAVPLVLAQQPEPAPEPAPVVTADESGETALASEPIVAPATAADRAKRRKVLGTSKNPFGVPRVDESGSAAATNSNGSTTAQDPARDGTSDDESPSSSGGDFPSMGGGAVPVVPVAPVAPGVPTPAPKRYAKYELTVRFGEGDSLERMNVKKLEALPLGEEPLVVYLGVEDGGKTAVFLVDSSIEPQGDGVCQPDPNTCETIELRAGETEFFDVVDENGEPVSQYQLDLLEIHGATKGSTAGRTAAARAAAPGALQYRASTAGVARTADVGLALR